MTSPAISVRVNITCIQIFNLSHNVQAHYFLWFNIKGMSGIELLLHISPKIVQKHTLSFNIFKENYKSYHLSYRQILFKEGFCELYW